MKILVLGWYRMYQQVMRFAAYFLPWRSPVVVSGVGAVSEVPDTLLNLGIGRVLIVTDETILELGLLDSLFQELEAAEVLYTVYADTVPNPTVENVESALKSYREQACDAVLAFGGGSALDCGKGVAARISRPKKRLQDMEGLLKVKRRTVPVIAVPTTAGTGSEATVAAVIHDTWRQRKFAVNDVCLIPDYAVLDPGLLTALPPQVTAATGIDALCHAVEAYIGRSNTRATKRLSREAIRGIFDNLFASYKDGADIQSRQNMQIASYKAGRAFTRAYVGNVHAIAHTLGAYYGVPHGLANAVVLPIVLEYYGHAVHPQLAELAELLEICQPEESIKQKAEAFVREIRRLIEAMGITETLDCIRHEDIPSMSRQALEEANPTYPVPRVFTAVDMHSIYTMIKTGELVSTYHAEQISR